MDVEGVLQSIKERVRDAQQEQRIKLLAQRIEAAFEKARAKGVKDELQRDWERLKRQFEDALRAVHQETGLY